jgi:hypothetical protein
MISALSRLSVGKGRKDDWKPSPLDISTIYSEANFYLTQSTLPSGEGLPPRRRGYEIFKLWYVAWIGYDSLLPSPPTYSFPGEADTTEQSVVDMTTIQTHSTSWARSGGRATFYILNNI